MTKKYKAKLNWEYCECHGSVAQGNGLSYWKRTDFPEKGNHNKMEFRVYRSNHSPYGPHIGAFTSFKECEAAIIKDYKEQVASRPSIFKKKS